MASSSFYSASLASQRSLLEQLVGRLLPTVVIPSSPSLRRGQAGEQAQRLTADRCVKRLKYHAFLDTNPSTVDIQFAEVVELLVMNAKHAQSSRLKHLSQKLAKMASPPEIENYHHSILRFLIHLAGDFVQNSRNEDMDVEMDIEEADDDKSERSVTDATDDDVAAVDASTLSDWSEDSREASINANGAIDEDDSDDECLNWAAYFLPTVEVVRDRVPERRPETSLLHQLAEVQLSEIPLSVCSLDLRSEAEVAVYCLSVLQGRPSSVFVWNRHSRQFSVDTKLQTLHHSAGAMRRALSWFARAGSYARCVHDWSAEILETDNDHGHGRPTVTGNCPTLSAVARAVQDRLQTIVKPAIEMETRLDAQGHLHPTVIQMLCLCGPMSRQLHVIYSISLEITALQSAAKSQRQMTCEILDVLHRLSTEDDLVDSPVHKRGREAIWNVFIDALVPLLSSLTAWLYLGDTSRIGEDFFISPVPARQSEDADFWLDGFPVDEDCCPRFLKPVMGVVRDGGKALQLTRRQAYGHRLDDVGSDGLINATRLEMLVRDDWTDDRLHRRFVDYLQNAVMRPSTELEESNDTGSIAEKMAKAGSYDGHSAAELILSSTVPWSHVCDTEKPYLIAPPSPQSSPVLGMEQDDDVVQAVGDASMELTDVPDSYVRMEAAMDRIREEMKSVFDFQAASQRTSVLSHCLRHPTDRLSYTTLRENIFGKVHYWDEHEERAFSLNCLNHKPPERILKEGLLDPLHTRSVEIIRSFIDGLLTDLGLMDELLMLKNVYLLGSAAMSEWTRRLSDALIHGHLLSDLSEFHIMLDMQECFRSCGTGEALPICGLDAFEELFFDMRPSEWTPSLNWSLCKERSPQELDECALIYPLKWPLCLVVNEARLKRYNAVFLFLLKLQWTAHAIEDGSRWVKRASSSLGMHRIGEDVNWRGLYRRSHEMMHIIKCLRQHVLQNVHTAFEQFCQGMVRAESVSELLNQHDVMLDAVMRFSFQTRRKQWKTVHARLQSLFHAVLNYTSIWREVSTMDPRDRNRWMFLKQGMEHVAKTYEESKSSLLLILQICSTSMPDNGELKHLVTLLNFNDVYQRYDT